MRFCFQHPDYWHTIQNDTKGSGDFIRSIKLFEDSEKAAPITEDQFIKVENIKGCLLLIGAEDDALWDTARYIRRMDERLKSHPHECDYKVLVYKYGTHFVFPESLMNSMLPASKFFLRFFFKSAKEHPEECRQTRIWIDGEISEAIMNWLIR